MIDARALDGVAAQWRRDARVLEMAFGGTSMLPAIRPAQPVQVDCGREPCVGEVAAFRFDGRIGVHRVVQARGDWLLTWGDANAWPDVPIRREALIGTLVDIPGAAMPTMRRWLLAWLAPPRADFAGTTRRIARLRAFDQARRDHRLLAGGLRWLAGRSTQAARRT